MEMNQINSTHGVSNQRAGSLAGTDLAKTFDNFLVLLTTQLQHQDPLSPLDTHEFTSQLVDFTGVEQAINTNRKLDELIAAQAGSQMTAAVSFIGKTVEVESGELVLQDDGAPLIYTLDRQAAKTAILVANGSGQIVRTLIGQTGPGRHEIVWDGTSDSGDSLPHGVYTFSVSAVDGDNQTVLGSSGIAGVVSGIESVGRQLILGLGDLRVPIERIRAVRDRESEQSAF